MAAEPAVELILGNSKQAVGRNVAYKLRLTSGPTDLDFGDLRILSEAKVRDRGAR